ncbi:hypothetical protein OESDEN_04395 [Oesophagostomum dentatum]|uniref:Uncharacterized protein n=1 Tax=Oesophagostomum dentatum TaxID=61180 RepID=A0A0B1TDR6_OESDE|nr:hypothetical protein OESDEN_04395 [Oesophagostomum dentatum]
MVRRKSTSDVDANRPVYTNVEWLPVSGELSTYQSTQCQDLVQKSSRQMQAHANGHGGEVGEDVCVIRQTAAVILSIIPQLVLVITNSCHSSRYRFLYSRTLVTYPGHIILNRVVGVPSRRVWL